jgi:hypothetical protein
MAMLVDDEHPSLALERATDGTFLLLVEGLDARRLERTNRDVRNGLLFAIADESTARKLAAAFLRGWSACEKEIASLIVERTDAPLGWQWDPAAIEAFAGRLLVETSSEEAANPLLRGRLQRNNGGPTSPEWSELANDLSRHSLPSATGVLIVVTGHPNQRGRELAEQTAIRFLYRGAPTVELDTLAKKKTPGTSSASTGLSGRSSPTNRPEPSSQPGTESVPPWSMLSWIISGARKHPISSVILFLLIGWGIGSAMKKKRPELAAPPSLTIPTPSTPAPPAPVPSTPAPSTPAPPALVPSTPAPSAPTPPEGKTR